MTSESKLCTKAQADLINIIYPGIKTGANSLVSSNSKFFAYSTFLSVYVYEQKTFNLINIITKNQSTISTISLATKMPKWLAISHNSKDVEIINIESNQIICEFSTYSPVVSFGWLKQDSQIVCFTRYYSEYFIFDASNGKKVKLITGLFDNIRVLAMTDSDEPIFFGGNYVGTVSRVYKGSGKSIEFKGRGNVVTSAFDPNNQSQCLIVWKQSWALFDVSTDIVVTHEVTDISYSLSSAAWSTFIPGQFFTGDEVTGNIRVWNGLSTTPIEIFSVYSAGVNSMVSLKHDRILIGFVDGMVGVYDIENRKFIFKNLSGHTSSILGLKFHPESPEIFVTAGQEGAVCTWNSKTMKQIDRITSFDHSEKFLSMDISPGGGMVACGYSTGDVAFFSLQTKSKIFEYKMCDQMLVSVNFSIFEPELVMVSSIKGFCAILNVQEKKIIWKSRSKLMTSIAVFSIHRKGQFIVTTDTGSILIFNSIKDEPDAIIDDMAKPRFFKLFFSPSYKDIIITTEDSGAIKIIDIEKKTIDLLDQFSGKSWAVVFHPLFEQIVAIGSNEGSVKIYDFETKKMITSFMAHQSPVLSMGFSPVNPNLLITAASDSSIKFWTIDSLFYPTVLENVIDQKLDWVRPIEGHYQLFKLARRCMKLDDKFTYRTDDVSHINDILRISKKTVQKQMSGTIRETSLIRRALKNKERMIQCAKQELFMGNVKHYCEMMFTAGNFDLAVAAAPAVSVNFWVEMMKNRAKLFDSKNDTANCLLAIGDTNGAIEALNESSDFKSAFLISASQMKGNFKFEQKDTHHHQKYSIKRPYIDLLFEGADIYNEYRTGQEMANNYLKEGQIDFAAAAYLSVGDVVNAEMLLMIHGQTMTAFLLDSLTKTRNPKVLERFAMLAIQSGVDKNVVFKIFSNNDEKDLELKKRIVLSLKFESISEKEQFFIENGLKKPSEYSGGENDVEILHNYLLSGQIKEGINFVISLCEGKLSTNFAEIEQMVKLIELTDLSEVDDKLCSSMASLSLYFAIYNALWKGYKKVIRHLKDKFVSCVTSNKIGFLSKAVDEVKNAIQLFEKSPDERRILYVGFNYLNPKSYGQYFDMANALGKKLLLEDNVTSLDMEIALMWFDLTPFSPATLKDRIYVP